MDAVPETRTLKQIQRDYHRSLYPPLRQRLRTASNRVIRGILYVLLAIAGITAFYAFGAHTVLMVIFILILLSFFTG
jgi:uncharacterized membrane protein YoaK (UPF0700 family)